MPSVRNTQYNLIIIDLLKLVISKYIKVRLLCDYFLGNGRIVSHFAVILAYKLLDIERISKMADNSYCEGFMDCDNCKTRNSVEFGVLDNGVDYYDCHNCDFMQVS